MATATSVFLFNVDFEIISLLKTTKCNLHSGFYDFDRSIDIFFQNNVDLVLCHLTNYGFSNKNGLDMCIRIREENDTLPILLYSGLFDTFPPEVQWKKNYPISEVEKRYKYEKDIFDRIQKYKITWIKRNNIKEAVTKLFDIKQ